MKKGWKPTVVGLVRGVLLAGAAAGITGLITLVGEVDLGDAAIWAPAILVALRTAEGKIDEWRGQQRQIPMGSQPNNVTAYSGRNT